MDDRAKSEPLNRLRTVNDEVDAEMQKLTTMARNDRN
jgi:hypothetical protein